jgi:hypothetical protein
MWGLSCSLCAFTHDWIHYAMYFKKMLRLIYYFIWAMISPSTEIDLIQLNLLFRKVRAQN